MFLNLKRHLLFFNIFYRIVLIGMSLDPQAPYLKFRMTLLISPDLSGLKIAVRPAIRSPSSLSFLHLLVFLPLSIQSIYSVPCLHKKYRKIELILSALLIQLNCAISNQQFLINVENFQRNSHKITFRVNTLEISFLRNDLSVGLLVISTYV